MDESRPNKPTCKKRCREHIESILCSKSRSPSSQKPMLDDLANVYKSCIKPMEDAYKFSFLQTPQNTVAEIYAKPSVLFLGPWSSGKTSIINYLLGLEGQEALRVGAEPTSADFVIIDKGPKRRNLAGTALIANDSRPYRPLEQYGMGLAARLQGKEFPAKILDHLSIIDTPGILETSDQQKRGYPYSEVCQFFIDRASLIFLVFDPSKLDGGKQLQSIFRKLKGHEGKLRILMNKVDGLDSLTLLRTYGALCWNLKSLMSNLPEPPRIHIVSLWSEALRDCPHKELLAAEETTLIEDIGEAIDNHAETVISVVLTRALAAETHAVTVDSYLAAFNDNRHRWLRWRNGALQAEVVDCPDQFEIPQRVGTKTSNHDGYLNVLTYRRFFQAYPLSSFHALQNRYGVIFSGATVLEKAQEAINKTIPNMLTKQKASRTHQSNGAPHSEQSFSQNMLQNTLETLRTSGEQLTQIFSQNRLASLWTSTPLGFMTQKVQGALKGFEPRYS